MFFKQSLLFVRRLLSSIIKHNIVTLAAVIAFFGFSAMIPLLLLMIYGTSVFVPQSTVQYFLSSVMQSYIPTIPDAKIYLAQNVSRLASLSSGKIGLIGVIGLLWTSVGGFVSFQQILDMIWEVREPRSFIKRYLVGFGMLGILVLLTVISSLTTIALALTRNFFNNGVPAWLALSHAISHMAFPLLLFITCHFCYRFLPSRTIRNSYLLIGALVSTIGIYFSRDLFMLYTQNMGRYEMIYGSLTFIMLFTFWIYIASVIVLFGAEVAVALETFREY